MDNDDQPVDGIFKHKEPIAVGPSGAPEIDADAAGSGFNVKAIPPDLLSLFLYYKRDRVGHESPVAVHDRLIQQFGVERASALIALFEQTAIPARPQEWRRRMH